MWKHLFLSPGLGREMSKILLISGYEIYCIVQNIVKHQNFKINMNFCIHQWERERFISRQGLPLYAGELSEKCKPVSSGLTWRESWKHILKHKISITCYILLFNYYVNTFPLPGLGYQSYSSNIGWVRATGFLTLNTWMKITVFV